MATTRKPSAIQVGVAPDSLSREVATLLALQRAEEPETPLTLHEVPASALHHALLSRRLDMAIAWSGTAKPALSAQPIWREELALALPESSPLLSTTVVDKYALTRYPLFRCCPCPANGTQAHVDLLDRLHPTQVSFAMMAVLVAAGYGVGIAPRSRILLWRSLSIVMRPVSGEALQVGGDLLHMRGQPEPAILRVMDRARRVSPSTRKSILPAP